MIRVVFIDIDDTLLSFKGYVVEAMTKGFEKFGLPRYEDSMFPVFHRINTGLWQQIEQGTLTYEELLEIRWNRIFEALGIDFDGRLFEKFFKEHMYHSGVPEEHAVELLEYLYGKYVICAASNGPFGQQVNRLRVAGMYEYFTHCFISGAVGINKPDRGFFDHCFRKLREDGMEDLVPGECVMIGDSLTSDIAGGKRYGMETIFYDRGKDPSEDLSDCDYVVGSLDEIKEIL